MSYIQTPSPNFDARTAPPDMIVLHYTGMPTGEAALAKMCDPAAMRGPNGSWKMATPKAMVASGVIRVSGEIRLAS